MRFLYRKYGRPDEPVTAKGALGIVMAEDCPLWAAQLLINGAVARVKLMRELARASGSERDTFEATVTAELHVELSPDPRDYKKQQALI